MRTLTRTIGTLAAAALAVSLAACGGAGTSDQGDQGAEQTKKTETKSFGDIEKSTTDDDDATEDDDAAKDADTTDDADAVDDAEDSGAAALSGLLTKPIENGYETGKHEATIEVEGYGTIKLELDADTAPVTVSNFADLANQGFYDGLTFHRIIKNFMIQGGDPLGTGMGDSGRNIVGEFSENGVDNDIHHKRGTISMARSFDPNSASSQFFICDSDDDTFLDGSYAAFGRVTKGMDVVDAIAADAKPTDDNGTIPAKDQPVITSIRVGDGSLG